MDRDDAMAKDVHFATKTERVGETTKEKATATHLVHDDDMEVGIHASRVVPDDVSSLRGHYLAQGRQ